MPYDALFTDYEKASAQPLSEIDTPSLVTCVVAYKDDVPSGRLCIYQNTHLRYREAPVLLFGNYDCTDDIAVSNALLAYVEAVAREKNIPFVVGPVSGNTWNSYRQPVKGAKAVFTGDLQQPLIYKNLIEHAGYAVMHSYYSAIADIAFAELPDEEALKKLESSGITIRGIDVTNYEEELKKIYKLCEVAFPGNVLFSHISEDEFLQKYLPFKSIITSDFVLLAEQDDEIIAVFFAYPDLLALPQKRLVIKTMARHPQRKVKDLVSTMIKILYSNAAEKGYDKIVHAFMHEDNRSRELSQQYEGDVVREYVVYIKRVPGE
mgnify:FL=1